jgi:hypothetical protein
MLNIALWLHGQGELAKLKVSKFENIVPKIYMNTMPLPVFVDKTPLLSQRGGVGWNTSINQSVSVSCNSCLEHRAPTTHRHRAVPFAATFTPFQFRPTALASIWNDLLQVLLGRPFVLNLVWIPSKSRSVYIGARFPQCVPLPSPFSAFDFFFYWDLGRSSPYVLVANSFRLSILKNPA